MKLRVWLQILLTVGLVASVSAVDRRPSFLERATSVDSPGPLEQDQTPSTRKDGERATDTIVAPSFRDFPRALAYNFTKGLFSQENIKPLVIGSAATVVVVPFDDEISEGLQGSASGLGDVGDVIGRPSVVGAATGVLILATPFIDNQRYRAFAFSLGQAWILNNALAEAIKASVSRTRPDGTDDHSFPSGHTSSSFAWASVAAHYYGKKVGIPAYIVASLIGVSRLERGGHFPSDVVFGATIGLISGLTAVRGSAHFGERRVTLLPDAGPHHVGMVLHVQF